MDVDAEAVVATLAGCEEWHVAFYDADGGVDFDHLPFTDRERAYAYARDVDDDWPRSKVFAVVGGTLSCVATYEKAGAV